MTVLEAKEEIHQKEALEIARMRLISLGNELEDNNTLAHYNISAEQTLNLFLRPADVVTPTPVANNTDQMPIIQTDTGTGNVAQEPPPLLHRRSSIERAQTALAAGVGIGLCIACCFLIVISGIDIAALVIGYNRKLDTYCTFSGLSGLVDPNLYLIVGGWTGFAVPVVAFFIICKGSVVAVKELEHNADQEAVNRRIQESTAPMTKIYTIFYMFNFAWGIIGAIIYGRLSKDCQNTPVGKMIISFVVIKLAFTCCSFSNNRRPAAQ